MTIIINPSDPTLPDCDFVDAKIDKRKKGCRERGYFRYYLIGQKNRCLCLDRFMGAPPDKDCVKCFGRGFWHDYEETHWHACKSHAREMAAIVKAFTAPMHRLDPTIKIRIENMKLLPAPQYRLVGGPVVPMVKLRRTSI